MEESFPTVQGGVGGWVGSWGRNGSERLPPFPGAEGAGFFLEDTQRGGLDASALAAFRSSAGTRRGDTGVALNHRIHKNKGWRSD